MGKGNVTTFTRTVSRYTLVALDSSCFIYHIEENRKYLPFTEVLFERLLPRRRVSAISSTLLLTEVLTKPIGEGRMDLVLAYKSIIVSFPSLRLISFDADIAEKAAYFRSQYDLRTPDAIHIATAFVSGAGAVVGNDAKWKKVREIDAIVLDEFIS